MEKPPTVPQKIWDDLDMKGKEFITKHEELHRRAIRAAKNKKIDDYVNAILTERETTWGANLTPEQKSHIRNLNDGCAHCGEGCDPSEATATEWKCNDCEHWNDNKETGLTRC